MAEKNENFNCKLQVTSIKMAVVEDIFPPFRLIEPEFYATRLKDGRVKIEI